MPQRAHDSRCAAGIRHTPQEGDFAMRSPQAGIATRPIGIGSQILAISAAAALLAFTLGVGLASANAGDHRYAENTFTKWITVMGPTPYFASMGGIVGGDVGDGTFSGFVVTRTPNATGVVIDAIYQFHGFRHSFTAPVHVVQTGTTAGATAVISGQVTDGWLAGNMVEGQYTVGSCTHGGLTTTCFSGTLTILRGTHSDE
jgi:hypothetical protein